MTPRVVRIVADVVAVAALAARLVAAAFEAMDRELGAYRVEMPDCLPEWVDDGSAQW